MSVKHHLPQSLMNGKRLATIRLKMLIRVSTFRRTRWVSTFRRTRWVSTFRRTLWLKLNSYNNIATQTSKSILNVEFLTSPSTLTTLSLFLPSLSSAVPKAFLVATYNNNNTHSLYLYVIRYRRFIVTIEWHWFDWKIL